MSKYLLHLVAPRTVLWKPININLDFFQPDFCWKSSKLKPLATSFPPIPKPTPWLIRRFWGFIHKQLRTFSYRYYCRWTGIQFNNQVIPLPFGLLLKWSDGTRLEECLATQAMRIAGLPVPNIICYGVHPECPHAPISILMTRVPGSELHGELWEWFEPEERATIVSELKAYMDALRSWQRPNVGEQEEDQRICSIIGTSVRSARIPRLRLGPCQSEQEFNNAMMAPAELPHVKLFDNYEQNIAKVALLHKKQHKILFAHGDLNPWNILVTYDGHLSAILDWESAGWYPEYWDYTTPCIFQRPGAFWYEIIMELSQSKYLEELEGDRAVHDLTCDGIGF